MKEFKEVLEKVSDNFIDDVNEACESLGVKVKDDKNNYRTTYDVLNDLSNVF